MFEKLYLVRLENPEYAISLAEAELSQPVMSASFSQREEEAAIVSVQYALQHGTWGVGNRYGILCGIDAEGAFRVLARGEVVGYPVGLAGTVVTVEIMCRRPDHVRRVDELWQSLSNFVPPHLDNSTDPRRAEMYVPKVVYHDPLLLEPRLVPMEGEGEPVEIYGEGAAWGQSQVLSVSSGITEAPAESVKVGADAVFDERLTLPVDFGEAFGTVETATPREFKDAVRKMNASGGHIFVLEKDVRAIATSGHVYTSHKAKVEPITCIIQPKRISTAAVVEYEIDFKAAVTVVQRRREVAELTVTPNLWKMGGASDVSFDVPVYDAEDLATYERSMSYQTGQWISIGGNEIPTTGTVVFKNIGRSVFVKNGVIENLLVLRALVGQAVREAVQRAHCVRLSLDIAASAVEGVRVGSRVRVHDGRIPGGRATGKVVALAMSWTSSATAILEILCPISGSGDVSGPDVTAEVGAGGGLIRVLGSLSAPADFSPPISQSLIALEGGDAVPFTGQVTSSMTYLSTGGADFQEKQIDAISKENDLSPGFGEGRTASNDIDDIEEFIDGTTISIAFRTPPHNDNLESMTTRYSAGSFRVVLPEGALQG